MTIHLLGDSIVQNYKTEEFIGGWGQYLPLYLDDNITIINHAKGGRSSRSFINEGRFNQAFEQVVKGDYIFIEFCHNDDASKPYNTMVNRLVELGEPDENGRYPLIPGEREALDFIPQEYIDALEADESVEDKSIVIQAASDMLAEYPNDRYYPYSANGKKGSYKWFLKQYVDEARERGAIPVLVTAPARGVLDACGKLQDGSGLHGGNDFCYIRAMKQLADEMKVPVIDLFEYSRALYEQIGADKVRYLMSIKQGNNEGVWPQDYENEVQKSETVLENTHFNKYGACVLARAIAELLAKAEDAQLAAIKGHLRSEADRAQVKEVMPKMLEGVEVLKML